MDWKSLAKAELEMAVRVAVMVGIGYGLWGLALGGEVSWSVYAIAVGVLLVAGNVTFFVARAYKPGLLSVAELIRES